MSSFNFLSIDWADPLVWVPLCVAMGATIIAVMILFIIVAVQRWTTDQQRRDEQLREVWSRLLIKSMMQTPQTLPPVRRDEAHSFLRLWNYLSESIRGDDKNGLNETMRSVGMDRTAVKMLKSYKLDDRLMAVVALGHLRERSVWNDLERLVGSPISELSLEAARSLIRIDSQAALAVLVPLIGGRADWSFIKVVTMLNEAGAERAVGVLAQAARGASPEATVRFVRCMEAIGSPTALPVIREIVGREHSPESVVVACLRCFGRFAIPQDLSLVRVYMTHPNRLVRLHAVLALGRIGTEDDEPRLIARLEDDEWWVRYRAAEVLAGLPFVDDAKLARLHAEHPLQQARDVLAPFVARCTQRIPQTTNG